MKVSKEVKEFIEFLKDVIEVHRYVIQKELEIAKKYGKKLRTYMEYITDLEGFVEFMDRHKNAPSTLYYHYFLFILLQDHKRYFLQGNVKALEAYMEKAEKIADGIKKLVEMIENEEMS